MEFSDHISKRLWNTCCAKFPILEFVRQPYENHDMYTENVSNLLLEHGFIPLIYHMIFNLIRKNISVHADFWNDLSIENEWKTLETVTNNIRKIDSFLILFKPHLNELEPLRQCHMNANITTRYPEDDNLEDCFNAFKLIVGTKILSDPGENYEQIYYNLYLASYKAYIGSYNQFDDEDGEMDLQFNFCNSCNNQSEQCKCKQYIEDVNFTFRFLSSFGLLEMTVLEFKSMMRNQIDKYVSKICEGNCFTGSLNRVLIWLQRKWDNYVKFLSNYFDYKHIAYEAELKQFAIERYTYVNIMQIFNIIIEYPESSGAVDDLRRALDMTNFRDVLITELNGIITTKLLNIGASTSDILTAYSLAYQTLQHLDPSGELVDTIIEPINAYLKTRDDTVYCIVSNIMADDASIHLPPVYPEEEGQFDGAFTRDQEDEEEEEEEPEQMDVSPMPDGESHVLNNGVFHNARKESAEGVAIWKAIFSPEAEVKEEQSNPRKFDIFSVVVEVLGSKQVFIDEYQKLLADRALTQFRFDMEKEQRCLEMLKIRIGDKDTLKCQAMLRDVTDSMKLFGYIQKDEEFSYTRRSFLRNPRIISGEVWPMFKDVSLKVPLELQRQFKNYERGYEKYRVNRKLLWKSHLGIVNLSIVLKKRKLSITVTPAHAVVIYHFQNQREWSIRGLEKVTEISSAMLRKKISYWVSHGILYQKSADVFGVVNENTQSTRTLYKPKLNLSMIYDEEGFEPAVVTSEEIKEEELQAFWSYIVGMLNNLNSLTLDRLCQMYTLFSGHNSDSAKTLTQLKAYLDKKVKNSQLIYHTGYYSLPR